MPSTRSRFSNGGGIGGTGIHAMFGSIVQCPVNDTSFFCSLTKLVQIIFMIGFLIFVVFLLYTFLKSTFRNSRK